jgi:hypothetical protein
METNIRFLSYLAQFFFDFEIFEPEVVEKIKHTFYVQQLFLNRVVYEKIRKVLQSRAGHR